MKRITNYFLVSSFLIMIGTISIQKLFLKQTSLDVKQLHHKSNIVPVVIIGSGPAGLSAALYTARADFYTIVISGDQLGGSLMDVKYIENWPGRSKTTGAQAMEELEAQAKQFGAKIIIDGVKSVDFSQWPYKISTENELELYALSVIIATGGTPKKLNIEGVDKYWGHGVGLCSLCEAPFNKGQDVAVIGGGDTASERALQLAAYAKKVYMIVRESTPPANATVQGYLKKNKNIEIKLNSELQKISGNDANVTSITIFNKEQNQPEEIPVNAVYFSIGFEPNTQLFKSFLKTDDRGFIVTDCCMQTTGIPGVFAAGNVATSDRPYGKAGVALGSGIKAGIESIQFLEKVGLTPQAEIKLEPQYYVIKE